MVNTQYLEFSEELETIEDGTLYRSRKVCFSLFSKYDLLKEVMTQLLNSAFISFGELCRSRRVFSVEAFTLICIIV